MDWIKGLERGGSDGGSENDRDIPVSVIDGKTYSWNEVRKMLMSNEGFQIRMEIFDMTDDLE